ncbi:MAG: FG-GAP repeat domain-containing protein, partial [Methylocella sp.]
FPRHIATFRWPRWGNSLAVTPFQDDRLVLLRGTDPCQGRVAARVPVPLSSHPRSLRHAERVTPADLDGDGVDELLFASSITNELFMLRHPGGEGPLRPELIRKFPAGAPNQVAVTDLDGNGAPDLIVPYQTKPFQIHILMNNGRASFVDASPLSFPTTMGIRRVAAGEDRDGANYVLAVGYGAIALYRFPAHWDASAAVPMRSVPMARSEGCQILLLQDIDGDGWLDGILGRGVGDRGAWIVYGPLWDHFDELATKRFILD